MPFAVAAPLIGAAIGAGGSVASGVGGKKASNKADALAEQQLGLQKQQTGLGNKALGASGDYWNALLHGGQAAVQATGPYASLIGQAGQGARNAIQANTARGGEQNLALAQNYNQTSNDVARLYAGMQPLAAQGLTGIGGAYLSSAGTPSPYAAASAYQSQMQGQQQAGAGFGNLLYNSLNKLKQGGAGGPTAASTATSAGAGGNTGFFGSGIGAG